MNPEELFADDRSSAFEQKRVHEDELHSFKRSILDWAISFLSEFSQEMVLAFRACGSAGAMGRGAERAPKPSDVSRCDSARVWWRGECGHSWQLSARTRAFNDAGCPYCGRRLTLEGFNSAECLDAGILHLWHSTKNGDLKPSQVSDRTARGSGCNARRAGTNGVRACGGPAKRAASVCRAMGEGGTISPRAATTSGQRGRTSPGSSTPS